MVDAWFWLAFVTTLALSVVFALVRFYGIAVGLALFALLAFNAVGSLQ
jgi:hypothetical protein